MSTIVGIPASRGNDGSVALQAIVDASPRLDELSTARLIQLIAEAAHGKTYALSPNAIVVEADGKVRLDAAALTAPAYASPEKLRGGATDRRSDVFSVGVLLWEALAHERLFEASSDEATAVMVAELEPRPPSESNANIPSELDAIAMKALAKDPGARYQSLKVMAAEIDAVLSDAGYGESNELIAKFLTTLQRPPMAVKTQPLPHVTPREPAAADPKKADQAKKAADGRAAEAKKVDDAKKAADAKAAEARVADAKKADDAKKAEEARRVAEAAKAAEAKRVAEVAAKAAEAARVAEAKAAEAKAAEARRIEEARKVEEARKIEEARVAEEKRHAAELAQAAEAARQAEAKMGEQSKKAAAAAEAARVAAAEAAAAIEAAKAAAAKAAEAIKMAESAEASKVEAVKAHDVAHDLSAKLVAAPRTISATIAEPKLDPTSFDPARAALGAPASNADSRTLSKSELNQTMMGVAPGPELVRPASASPPPPNVPAILKDKASGPVAGLPAMPPGASPTAAPPLKEAAKAGDVHDAVTQRVPKTDGKRNKSESGSGTISNKKFDKKKGKQEKPSVVDKDDEKTRKFEKGDGPADPAEVVSLPRSDRASGKIDVWFSATDSVAHVDEDDQFEPHKTRNPLVYIGGAVGLVVVVIILAFAFSGGSDKDKDKKTATGNGSAIAAAKPTETPLVPDPNAPVPTAATGSNGSSEQGSASLGSGAGSGAGSGTPAVGSDAIAVVVPPDAAAPAPPPPDAAPLAPQPPVVVDKKPPVVDKKPIVVDKKPPVVDKKPPQQPVVAHQKPVDPYVDTKPKGDPQELLKAGLQQYARGETGPALASFRGAIAANPGFSPAYRGMGLVYEKMGNRAQARIAYKKYLQLAPTAGDADQIRERMEKL